MKGLKVIMIIAGVFLTLLFLVLIRAMFKTVSERKSRPAVTETQEQQQPAAAEQRPTRRRH